MDLNQKLKSENIRLREGFEASDSWIKKFMNRFELASKTFTGESESADRSQIEPFKEKFKTICEKYNPDDIYNCDETGLYFRLGPNKTVTLKNENCKGTKPSHYFTYHKYYWLEKNKALCNWKERSSEMYEIH